MYVPQEPQMERHPLARSSCGVVGPTDWNEALDIIRYGSPEQVLICLVYIFILKLIEC